jgi:hypothetical protein
MERVFMEWRAIMELHALEDGRLEHLIGMDKAQVDPVMGVTDMVLAKIYSF